MRVVNVRTGKALGDTIASAGDSRARRTGLLKHTALADGEGLWIAPCEAVHTFGMNFAIDVLFLSRKNRVLKIKNNMTRRRIALCLRAHSVLELPAGKAELTDTQPGDDLQFER